MDDQTASPAPQAPAGIRSPRDMLKTLREAYPVFREHRPLAIGIDKQVIAARPDLEKKLLRAALGIHTRAIPYLKALQSATHRYNLDGSESDPVTPEQHTLAAQKLREIFKASADKRRADEAAAKEAAKAAEAEQERQRKLAALTEKFGRK